MRKMSGFKRYVFIVMIIFLISFVFGCTSKEMELEKESIKKGEEIEEFIELHPENKISVENLTLLNEYSIDFNGDGFEEKISMYTTALEDEDGNIMWDDGQDWLFVVHGKDKDYVLYDDYVQLGNIEFYVYTTDDGFFITTISPRTASFGLTRYRYDKDNDIFVMDIPFREENNVNMLYQSGNKK